MKTEQEIKLLQSHYESLACHLLALLRTGLLPKGSQELHEAKLNYDRWLAKSHILKLVLNEDKSCSEAEANE